MTGASYGGIAMALAAFLLALFASISMGSADARCGPKMAWSHRMGGCVQEKCPPGAGRNSSGACSCYEAEWGGEPKSNCFDKDGFVAYCAPPNGCDALKDLFDPDTGGLMCPDLMPKYQSADARFKDIEVVKKYFIEGGALAILDPSWRHRKSNPEYADKPSDVWVREARAAKGIVEGFEESLSDFTSKMNGAKDEIKKGECSTAEILVTDATKLAGDTVEKLKDFACVLSGHSDIVKETREHVSVNIKWPNFGDEACDCNRFEFRVVLHRQKVRFGINMGVTETEILRMPACGAKDIAGEVQKVSDTLDVIPNDSSKGHTGIAGFGSYYQIYGELVPLK